MARPQGFPTSDRYEKSRSLVFRTRERSVRIGFTICTLMACLFATAASAEYTFNARGKLACGSREIAVDRAKVSVGLNARSIHIEFTSGGSSQYLVALDLEMHPNDGAIDKGVVRAYKLHARCSQRDWYLERANGPDPGEYDDFEALTIQLWLGGKMAARVTGKDPRSNDLAWTLEFDGIVK